MKPKPYAHDGQNRQSSPMSEDRELWINNTYII